MKLSIIVPLFNEEREILRTIEVISKLPLPEYVTEREIIVVDDGSTDRSYDLVKESSYNVQAIKLLKHPVNSGKGAAVQTGLKAATGEVIVIQDADMELLPQDICSMLEAMMELGVKFVNGSRYLAGVNRPLFSYWRYLANQFFTLITSIIVNVKITDIACGYKMFRKDFIERIALHEKRFGFEAELMIKAIRNGTYREVAEVPVHYAPRNIKEGKKIRNHDAFNILLTIFKYGVLRMK